MHTNLKLSPESLKLTIEIANFEALTATTTQSNILGQPRAQSALEFGLAMTSPGYNVFVMGEPGLGRLSMITSHLDNLSQHLPTPPSYAYVDNFANQREPLAIQIPAGQGQVFCSAIENLIDSTLVTFPAVFESPSYQQKKSAIERTFNQAYNKAIDLVEKRARALNIALFRENEGVTFAPIENNKPLDDDQFAQLPQAERDAFHQHVEELEDYLSEALLDLPQWRRALAEKIKQLDCETIKFAITPLFAQLEKNYQPIDYEGYLSEIKANLNTTLADYLAPARTLEPNVYAIKRSALIELYLPNIVVDHEQGNGAPVIYEPHPTYQNLFGRIEYTSDQGTLTTSYRHISPGALHKANGGYLILDAEKLLTYPFVWEALKRALKSNRIEIESPYSDFGISTTTLKPQNIPLNLKIILVGAADIYYLLEELDSEFNEIFKVLADFDGYIPLNHDPSNSLLRS